VTSSTQREALRLESLPVPEALLVPLLDVAASVLAGLDPKDVPGVLRPLAGFDRRRLTTSGPARQQLRRAFEVDEGFRDAVVESFREQAEVVAALEAWSIDDALERVDDAVARADLALLASSLYAARPRGWTFGLGIALAAAERDRTEQEREDDAKAWEVRLATVEEARRRAEQTGDDALAESTRLEAQLRDERAARRAKEESAEEEVQESEQRRRDAEMLAEQSVVSAQAAEARLAREADRARDAEHRLRSARRELDARLAADAERQEPPGRLDLETLTAAAGAARQLAASLEGLTQGGRDDVVGVPHVSEAPTAAPKRTRVPCPPGMRADTPEALDTMLRTRGVTLIVDGYNVSMAGWADASARDQRTRLLAALERLHRRVRCDVLVVFDGADVVGVSPPTRAGVHVVFSADGEEADPVIVREVSARPKRVPVIVVSSDGWVRDHAEAEGATVVPSPVLLDVLRH
jgi:predicted RNA-binding protein with PIN domain